MDVNADGRPNATEPMGYYTGLFLKVITGSATTGIDIKMIDPPQGNATIKGEVSFNDGNFNQTAGLSMNQNIVVQAVGVSETPVVSIKLTDVGQYQLEGLKTGLYIVMAYADENDDRIYNFGEPIGFYEEVPIMVLDNTTKEDVNIQLGDFMNARGSLEGTVSYEGSKTGPIKIFNFGYSVTPMVVKTLEQPADYLIDDMGMGIYLTLAFMDVNQNGRYEQREPFGFYTGFNTVEGFQTTEEINIELIEGGTGGISGTVHYQGDLAGKIYIGTTGLSNTPFTKISISEPGAYSIPDLAGGSMLVWAFMDVNGDKLPGLGEPFAIKPELISVSEDVTTTDIDLYLKSYLTTSIDVFELGTWHNVLILEQNYPNPFNAETNIQYFLPEASTVVLKIFNTLGHEIKQVPLGEQVAGYHTLHWDAKDKAGNLLATGIYIYQIEGGRFLATRKLLLVR